MVSIDPPARESGEGLRLTVEPFIDAGADMITVHDRSCPGLDWTLGPVAIIGSIHSQGTPST